MAHGRCAVLANSHRHVGGVWAWAIVAEWFARCESRAGVERVDWCECFMDPSLQAYVFEAALSGDSEEVVKHRAANAQAADMPSGVHGLQLRVPIIEPLERADRDQSSRRRMLKRVTAGSSRPSTSSACASCGGLCKRPNAR